MSVLIAAASLAATAAWPQSDPGPPPGAPQAPAPPTVTSEAVRTLAAELRDQAARSRATAAALKGVTGANVIDTLRGAEIAGVGGAWEARKRISRAAPDAFDVATPSENRLAQSTLSRDAEALDFLAAQLEFLAAQDRPPGGPTLLQALDGVVLPPAAAKLIGAPEAAPDGRFGHAGAEIPASALFVIGSSATTTIDYPAIGAVVVDGQPRQVSCTATLIAPRVVLTAAHCIPEKDFSKVWGVFFQNSGLYELDPTAPNGGGEIRPGFWASDILTRNDLALLKLAEPVTHVRPVALPDREVRPGEIGRIVGFGKRNHFTDDGQAVPGTERTGRAGLKLHGLVEVRSCEGAAPPGEVDILCWEFKGGGLASVGTCKGDSGGPLLMRRQGGWVLAGVTAYGAPLARLCEPGSFGIDMDVHRHLAWIQAKVRELDPAPAAYEPWALDPVENGAARFVIAESYFRNASGLLPPFQFRVAPGGRPLRITLNATDRSTATRMKVQAPGGAACDEHQWLPLLTCAIADPQPGRWEVRIEGAPDQELQLTAARY